LLRQEWLVTNGLGGYASGTISGSVTWRYHGLLIAALAAPLGRVVMHNHLAEFVRFPDGRALQIGGEEPSQPEDPLVRGSYLTEFRLENQLPVWRYEVEGILLEKHVLLLYGQNTVHITFRLLSNQERVRLELRPSLHFRSHERPVSESLQDDYVLSMHGTQFEILAGNSWPPLRLHLRGTNTTFTYEAGTRREIYYQKDAERGYESRGLLWSPGHFGVDLSPRQEATLIGSTEPWNTLLALSPEEALSFYHDIRDGLIPNMFPEGRNKGLYHTADATLWFNALSWLEQWLREERGPKAAEPIARQVRCVRESFNRRFWYAEGGYLYDVVDTENDGNDTVCRPNQGQIV
jgi:glycogen debranching enzyme